MTLFNHYFSRETEAFSTGIRFKCPPRSKLLVQRPAAPRDALGALGGRALGRLLRDGASVEAAGQRAVVAIGAPVGESGVEPIWRKQVVGGKEHGENEKRHIGDFVKGLSCLGRNYFLDGQPWIHVL